MFSIFKKKSKLELLEEKYQKLVEEAYKLSTINRTQSDQKTAEADVVLKEIELLESNSND